MEDFVTSLSNDLTFFFLTFFTPVYELRHITYFYTSFMIKTIDSKLDDESTFIYSDELNMTRIYFSFIFTKWNGNHASTFSFFQLAITSLIDSFSSHTDTSETWLFGGKWYTTYIFATVMVPCVAKFIIKKCVFFGAFTQTTA